LPLVAELGFTFNLVTNGCRFIDHLLPLLTAPAIREKLAEVCFSLDGSKPETHDALRGAGSFREVVEGAASCKLKGIRLSFKSIITTLNKDELSDLALLGVSLGAHDHAFLHPFPSRRLIQEGLMPPPEELREIVHWISSSLAPALRNRITVEGYISPRVLFTCDNILEVINVDFQGYQQLCCNLSHVAQGDGEPSRCGRERLADLKEVPLREGVIRHFRGVARLIEARLKDMEKLAGLNFLPCYWCFAHFGKFTWMKDFPDSPWAAGVLGDKGVPAAG